MADFLNGFKCNLFSQKRTDISKTYNNSKKCRSREELRRKIKKHLSKKRVDLSSETHDVSCASTDEGSISDTTPSLESCNNLKAINLAKIIEKLWKISAVDLNETNNKVVWSGQIPCFLQRNTKLADKEMRSRVLKKRKKPSHSFVRFVSKKSKRKTLTRPDFYFRFRTHCRNTKREILNSEQTAEQSATTEQPATTEQSATTEQLDISSVEPHPVKTEQTPQDMCSCHWAPSDDDFVRNNEPIKCFPATMDDQKDSMIYQIKYVPLFSNKPRLWKSVVEENHD